MTYDDAVHPGKLFHVPLLHFWGGGVQIKFRTETGIQHRKGGQCLVMGSGCITERNIKCFYQRFGAY